MPGASSMRGVTGFRVLDAVNGALAQLIPDRVPAAGEGGNTLAIFGAERPEGGRFVYYELVVGTWGATPLADGNDGVTNPASLAANIPVEVAESEFPIVVERYGLVPDSGGAGSAPGRARDRARLALPDARHVADRPLRSREPARRTGSRAAARARRRRTSCVRPDGSEESCRRCSRRRSRPATSTSHRIAGGGGFGDPLERDPALVGARRRERKGVDRGRARRSYGVVIGGDGAVDTDATERLRAERRSEAREGQRRRRRHRRRDHRGERRPLPDHARLRRRRARREAAPRARLDAVLGRARPAALHERGRDQARRARRREVRERRGGARRRRRLRAATGTWCSRPPRRRTRSARSSRCSRSSASRPGFLTPDEVVERWPELEIDGIELACYEETSGYADPVRTVEALARSARASGLDVREGCEVLGHRRPPAGASPVS